MTLGWVRVTFQLFLDKIFIKHGYKTLKIPDILRNTFSEDAETSCVLPTSVTKPTPFVRNEFQDGYLMNFEEDELRLNDTKRKKKCNCFDKYCNCE